MSNKQIYRLEILDCRFLSASSKPPTRRRCINVLKISRQHLYQTNIDAANTGRIQSILSLKLLLSSWYFEAALEALHQWPVLVIAIRPFYKGLVAMLSRDVPPFGHRNHSPAIMTSAYESFTSIVVCWKRCDSSKTNTQRRGIVSYCVQEKHGSDMTALTRHRIWMACYRRQTAR